MVAFFCPPRWGGAGGRPFGHEFCASTVVPTGGASTVIATLDIGEPDPKRLVVVGAGTGGASALLSATIGGVPATIDSQLSSPLLAAIAYAFVPNSTEVEIVLSYNASVNRDAMIGAWAIYGLDDAEPVIIGTRNGGGNANRTTTFTVDAPSVLIAVAKGDETANSASPWTGDLMEDWFEQGITGTPRQRAGGASLLVDTEGSFSATTRCRAIIGLGWTEP